MITIRHARELALAALSMGVILLSTALLPGTATAHRGSTGAAHHPGMVTRRFSDAETAKALAYWNSARMRAATPQAGRPNGSGSAGPNPRNNVPAGTPSGTYFDGIPVVGAVFFQLIGGLGVHYCTGTVIVSRHSNRLLTAAHCLERSQNLIFVPNYHNGTAPYGRWPVSQTFVDARYAKDHDNHDFAFAAVKAISVNGRTQQLQQVVGADEIAFDRTVVGTPVHLVGYPMSKEQAVQCTNTVTAHGRYSEFDCGNFADGTSGSGWVQGYDATTRRGTVVGVTGGPDQGGPNDAISYSDPFDSTVQTLYQSAEQTS